MDQTQQLLEQLGALLTPGRLMTALLVLLSAWLSSKALQWVLQRLSERSTTNRLRVLRLQPTLRISIWAVAVWIVIFPVFQPEQEVVMAMLGGSAIAIGLAIQDTLKNLIGGLTLLFDRPFQVGDKITLAGHFGEVSSIGLRSVRLVTNDDNTIIIPNALLTTNSVDNSNFGSSDFQVVMELYLTEPCDLARVERLAWEAAVSSPFVYLKKPVVVRLAEQFEQQAVTKIRIKAYVVDVRLEMRFHTDVMKRAKIAFTEAGFR